MQAVSVYVVALLVVALLAWSAVNEDISCVLVGGEPVSERGSERVSEGVSVAGFYAARGGVYMRRGRPVRVLPDFFSLISERVSDAVSERASGVVVSQDRHRWLVQQQWRSGSGSGAAAVRRRELFRHTPRHAQQFLFSPPPGDWRRVRSGGVEEEEASDLAVKQCHGSLVSVVIVVSVVQCSVVQCVQCSAVCVVQCSECSAECAM